MDRQQLPNFRLSLLVAFYTTTVIVTHCHSSQIDPPHTPALDRDHHGGGQSRFLSLSAGSQIHGGKSPFHISYLQQSKPFLFLSVKLFFFAIDVMNLNWWMTFRLDVVCAKQNKRRHFDVIPIHLLTLKVKPNNWIFSWNGQTPF